MQFSDAFKYDNLTFQDVLANEIGVMDSTAIALCKDNKIPIVVFNIFQPGNIAKAISGEPIGSRISNSRADAFVSIHANATRGKRKDVNGLETYYYSGYKGYSLAKNIQKQILIFSPQSPDRGVRRSRFYVIRKTSMPAALVEIGFVTGIYDADLLRQKAYRDKMSFAIAKGILNYLRGSN